MEDEENVEFCLCLNTPKEGDVHVSMTTQRGKYGLGDMMLPHRPQHTHGSVLSVVLYGRAGEEPITQSNVLTSYVYFEFVTATECTLNAL